MSVKGFFKNLGKGFLKGAEVTLPIIAIATPPGSIAARIARVITAATDKAQETDKAGREKLEDVTVEVLAAAEAESGKNFDSPAGRALVQKGITLDVEIKKHAVEDAARVKAFYDEFQAYLESIKAPAQADTAV